MIGGSLVIGRSTLMIGTMDKIVKPIQDKSKKVYDLAFCPERTLEGKALEELKYLPQIIGSNSIKSSNRAAQIFQFLTPTIIKVSSLKAAETIKLIDNVSRDVNFAFANEVATICDEIGINAYEVISAGKQGYPRTNIPLPGPVGGPCLSKDPYILIQSLSMREFKPKITISARETNEKISEYTSKVVLNHVKKFKNKYDSKLKISLLGLAFKGRPETDDLRGTTAIPIFNTLKDKFPGADFYGWDKLVNDNKIIKLGLIPLKSLDEAFENSDVVIILNNHKDFSNISLIHKSRKMNAYGLIYDLWNHFSNKKHNLENNVVYNALGNLENGDN
jgi:nucleotide sugar dehydrogenase